MPVPEAAAERRRDLSRRDFTATGPNEKWGRRTGEEVGTHRPARAGDGVWVAAKDPAHDSEANRITALVRDACSQLLDTLANILDILDCIGVS
jgi:hypothetical protein